jgi:FkbM family methyltransferase
LRLGSARADRGDLQMSRVFKRIKRHLTLLRRSGVGIRQFVRLWRSPRYVPGRVHAFGHELMIVDACTFLSGLEEIFGVEKYRFVAATDAPLVLDCGANIGLSVLYFKMLYPRSRVVAFEPDPKIFQALQHNVHELGLQDVELRCEAVWCEKTMMAFAPEGGFSGRIATPSDRGDLLPVPAIRLRDLLTGPVDFLKIDIEGAEGPVIADCVGVLRNAAKVFVEYHSHSQEPQVLHEILGNLCAEGFRYHIKEAYASPQPFLERPRLLGMDLQLDIFAYEEAVEVGQESRGAEAGAVFAATVG